MYTKSDFQEAFENSLANYPTIQARFEAGDPQIIQHMDAMATMMALVSAQIETAQNEIFNKTRNSTVLADAAMRGIVRKGKAARAQITAENTGDSDYTIETSRTLVDSSGRSWIVATSATVAAGETATFEAVQTDTVTITHTVENTEPFYSIEIPEADDGSYLCTISVSDSDGEYEYKDRYTNIEAGDRIYHVEADDTQTVYVRFGWDDIVGVQPEEGAEITLTVTYTAGDIEVDSGAPFSFEYIQDTAENYISLTMDSMLTAGENPISIPQLRDLAKYPCVYDSDAVFLGEFDFLIRRNFTTLQFLSVWNEVAEENARGADVSNINCLFVAVLSADGGESVLEQEADGDEVQPTEIDEDDYTDTQKEIEEKILYADDSYRVRFYTPVISKIYITVDATVSTSYIASDIKAQIKESLLDHFGAEAAAAKRGQFKVLYRRVYEYLKDEVPALSDAESDFEVSISDYYSDNTTIRPELWRYCDEDSLTINVDTANITTFNWGG